MIEAAERDGRLKPGRHDRRADLREHRHRSRHRRSGERLQNSSSPCPRTCPWSVAGCSTRYGAELVLTPAIEGMTRRGVRRPAAMQRPLRLLHAAAVRKRGEPGGSPPDDRAEILEATGGRLDAFVAGVGTGGTITGVGRSARASSAGRPHRGGRAIAVARPERWPCRDPRDPGHRRQFRAGRPEPRRLRRMIRASRTRTRSLIRAGSRAKKACSSASPPAPMSGRRSTSRSSSAPAKRVVTISAIPGSVT